MTVKTGLFGTSESFVPLSGASISGSDIVVTYDKDTVKDAPRVDADGHLTPDEEDSLYAVLRLGRRRPTARSTTVAPTTTGAPTTTQDADRPATVGRDTSGPTTDDAMTPSEERLNVGTQTREAGRARLRKYVVTENVTQTVPVSRKRSGSSGSRSPTRTATRPLSGPDISEEEHEVVLHEERPVVEKEAVPVERVRLDTETVTDEVTVNEEVRKEQIDTDIDGDTRHRPVAGPIAEPFTERFEEGRCRYGPAPSLRRLCGDTLAVRSGEAGRSDRRWPRCRQRRRTSADNGRTPARAWIGMMIVRAALDSIDRNGSQGLTMRGLALRPGGRGHVAVPLRRRPGRSAGGGRRHAAGRSVAEPGRAAAARRWQGYLQGLAHAVRRIAVEHPAAFPLVATRHPAAPWLRPPLRSLELVDDFLSTLSGFGFTDEQVVGTYRAFSRLPARKSAARGGRPRSRDLARRGTTRRRGRDGARIGTAQVDLSGSPAVARFQSTAERGPKRRGVRDLPRDLAGPSRARTLPVVNRVAQLKPAKIGGSANSIADDQVRWVRIGASTPPPARRCSPTTAPSTAAAKTSTGLPPATVASA